MDPRPKVSPSSHSRVSLLGQSDLERLYGEKPRREFAIIRRGRTHCWVSLAGIVHATPNRNFHRFVVGAMNGEVGLSSGNDWPVNLSLQINQRAEKVPKTGVRWSPSAGNGRHFPDSTEMSPLFLWHSFLLWRIWMASRVLTECPRFGGVEVAHLTT